MLERKPLAKIKDLLIGAAMGRCFFVCGTKCVF